jgi:oxygen-independent coproporphyrinogen-3 oxidase
VSEQRIRRNVHTYPFKYRRYNPESFFEPERGVAYVHIPFCATKCHFCDYVIQTDTTTEQQKAYVTALNQEIARFSSWRAFPEFQLHAIYLGGGTPGLLATDSIVSILRTFRDHYRLTSDCEICIEFDPASVELEKVRTLRDEGFTRFSMGIQSFDADILKQNNRPHNLEDCYRAWDIITKCGLTHTNIDLIYPLLNLDLDTWRDSLERAIAFGAGCITAYSLEVWPNTAYHSWLKRQQKELPDSATETAMCRLAIRELEAAGYLRGSTGGYFHPDRCDRYSRFLEYYWRTYPMIGFGVSSKSVIHNRLWTNIRSRKEYIRRIHAGEPVMDFGAYLTKEQEMRRVMIRGLKMCEVSKSEFANRFGVHMDDVFAEEIREIIALGYVEDRPDSIVLTREGQIFSTNVWERFYTEDDVRAPHEDEVHFGLSELVIDGSGRKVLNTHAGAASPA